MENVDPEAPQSQNELEDKRIYLLQEIQHLGNTKPLDSQGQDQLSQLKQQYNLIRGSLDSLSRQTSWIDPAEKLPEELWEVIIREAAASTDYLDPRLDVDILLTYTSVSTKWENTILSNPRLWTVVSIDNTTHDVEAKISMCLYLSGDLPLYLRISVPTPTWSAVATSIAEHRHRIRSIVARCSFRYPYRPSDYEEITLEALYSVMESFDQLPILETFDAELYTMEEADLDHIFPITDSWRGLRGVSLSAETLSTPSLRNLRKVTSTSSLEILLPSLELLDQLSEVICYGADGQDPSPAAQGGPLPWTLLIASSLGSRLFNTVLGRVSSTLSTLNTRVAWEDLSGLISTTCQLSRLQSLHLSLPLSLGSEVKLLFHDTPAFSIETLSIEISARNGNEMYSYKSHGHPNITSVLSILPKWVPSVRKIVIETAYAGKSVLPCAPDLEHLTDVSFYCDWEGYTDIEPTQLPKTVEKLEFYGTKASFATVHYTEILHLALRICDGGIDNIRTLQPILHPPSQLSSIKFLYVKVIGKGWRGVSFPRVEKLLLGSSDGGGESIFSFCEALALEPTAFPSLEHLGLEDYPEWDILFIMLERRNIIADPSISRIKRIGLPATPPLQILRPLQNLLRGEYSSRPSNWELSLAGNASIFFDLTILGCEMCHSALHFCHSAINLFQSEDGYEIPVLEYPDSVDEILATRDARMKRWQGLRDSKPFSRIAYCHRHYRYHPMIITGHYLSGVSMFDRYSSDTFYKIEDAVMSAIAKTHLNDNETTKAH